jgi:hypothetical protein
LNDIVVAPGKTAAADSRMELPSTFPHTLAHRQYSIEALDIFGMPGFEIAESEALCGFDSNTDNEFALTTLDCFEAEVTRSGIPVPDCAPQSGLHSGLHSGFLRRLALIQTGTNSDSLPNDRYTARLLGEMRREHSNDEPDREPRPLSLDNHHPSAGGIRNG